MTTILSARRGAAGIFAFLSFAVACLAAALVLGAAPAHAEGAALTVSKSTGLDPAGENVTVTGKGFAPGIQVFVAVCDPAQPAGKACDMANYKMATVDAGGGFVADVKLVAKFGQTDCTATPCAVQTSRMGNGKDRTQEALAAIGFTGGVAPTLPSKPQENAGAPGAGAPAGAASAPAAAAPSGAASAPADNAAASSDDDSDSNTGLIIGVVAGVVVVAGGAGVFFFRRRSAS
ncbi:hypothetical protein GCM10023205_43910 [Yinghuangia aomiensis]|uniref:Neocarzinostatin family protein n=1 Tax=Yinghuangia aomiensis TaxID=676205 RepID=A0ABP9HK29_9ACTN